MAKKRLTFRNRDCLMGGCEDWEKAFVKQQAVRMYDSRMVSDGDLYMGCRYCGFNPKEDERRKNLPMRVGKDGTQRKMVFVYEESEPEQEAENRS